MRIVITLPKLTPNGGIRVGLEWACRLSQWHEVYLLVQQGSTVCTWYKISRKVKVVSRFVDCDCLIVGSPHGVDFLDRSVPKKFVFAQMAEGLFRPDDKEFGKLCYRFYTAPYPMFSISKWNIDHFRGVGRSHETIYIGNGVNFDHFPIEIKPKSLPKSILIEGSGVKNPSKDKDGIAVSVAKRLYLDGYKVNSYSQVPFIDKYIRHYIKPDLRTLNGLYSQATILIKASVYDARSTTSLEAATKGTVTARAIFKGDDDLLHLHNCIKVDYNEEKLYEGAKLLLENDDLRNTLAKNYLEQIQKYNWDYYMAIINERICRES